MLEYRLAVADRVRRLALLRHIEAFLDLIGSLFQYEQVRWRSWAACRVDGGKL